MARARKQAKTPEQTESLARKIWLAGLGAYGMSLEDAQGQIGRASQEATKLFQELVQKGQDIEDQSKDAIRSRLGGALGKIDEARQKITGRVETNTHSVEDMMQKVRERMGLDTSVGARVDALSERVDSLARALGKLAGGASKSGKRPASKPAAKKTAHTARTKRRS